MCKEKFYSIFKPGIIAIFILVVISNGYAAEKFPSGASRPKGRGSLPSKKQFAFIPRAKARGFLRGIKPEALRNPSIFSGTGHDRIKDALALIYGPTKVEPLILSHSIDERWYIQEIRDDKIDAIVKFYSNGRLIGEAHLQLSRMAASVMTCWFKSYQKNQKIGEEFAARIYLRSQQLSEWLGFNTQYAHMYFYLSFDEEQEGIDSLRLRYAALIDQNNSI